MGKSTYSYEDFLNSVDIDKKDMINEIHGILDEKGYGLNIKPAKNGYVASYIHPNSKKTMMNYVFRKKGIIARIYGDNVDKYESVFDSATEDILKNIDKASVCKRLIGPDKCNSKCSMGYIFKINGQEYIKCRSNCFMFLINDENFPFIKSFIENEDRERAV